MSMTKFLHKLRPILVPMGPLEKIIPQRFEAVGLGWVMFYRGKHTYDLYARYESIHFQQQVEMLFVFNWLAWAAWMLHGLIKYRSLSKAYSSTPFEKEAQIIVRRTKYNEERKLWGWTDHV
jgi:hypothetical protein